MEEAIMSPTHVADPPVRSCMSQAAATVWKKDPTLDATDANHRFR